MAASRSSLALASLVLTAGAILLQLLVILAGTRDANPLNQIYFLRADTGGIQGAPPMSQWTLWNYCDASQNGLNTNCDGIHPAYPFDPPRNFNTNISSPFEGTHKYYYLTRFMFAFVFIAVFFAVMSLFTGLLALCSRLGGAISGFLASIALFFQALAAALMTAAYVMGKNSFKSIGRDSSVGIKAFAFEWAAVACLFIATILFCLVLATGRKDTTYKQKRSGGGFFGRKKSTRSRGSFIDSEKRTSFS
ncbi:MAG: hypothetical protein M4579_001749 [Chaenotheca gracillima]|nr:MAG: hypothetical protein M4579_001749 [Chaenotheca gracillima]